MKKILFILFALVAAIPVCAQTDDVDMLFPNGTVEKPKKNRFFIGLKGGATFTSVSDPLEGKLGDGNGIGYSGGIAMKMRFGRATENSPEGTGFWGVGFELKYKQNVAKTVGIGFGDIYSDYGDENVELKAAYAEIPVYFHVYPFAKSSGLNTLYLEAGVSFGKILSCSPKYLYLDEPSEEYDAALYELNGENTKLSGGDIHPIFGLGYTIPRTCLDFSVRYHMGCTSLAKNFNSKMSTIEASLCFMFKAGKF